MALLMAFQRFDVFIRRFLVDRPLSFLAQAAAQKEVRGEHGGRSWFSSHALNPACFSAFILGRQLNHPVYRLKTMVPSKTIAGASPPFPRSKTRGAGRNSWILGGFLTTGSWTGQRVSWRRCPAGRSGSKRDGSTPKVWQLRDSHFSLLTDFQCSD